MLPLLRASVFRVLCLSRILIVYRKALFEEVRRDGIEHNGSSVFMASLEGE